MRLGIFAVMVSLVTLSLSGCISNMRGNDPTTLFDEYAIGKRYMREGQPGPALVVWQDGAKKDNCNAQFALANLYAEGRWVRQDWQQAETLWLAAAQQGHLAAQDNLITYYISDSSSPLCQKLDCPNNADYDKAYHWAAISKMISEKIIEVEGEKPKSRAALFEVETPESAEPEKTHAEKVLSILETKVSDEHKQKTSVATAEWKPAPKFCDEYHLR